MYPRVSTDGQTIEAQIAELDRFIRSRPEWRLVAPAETYADRALSGTLGPAARPGLQRLLGDAADGKFDLVAMCGVSRASRGDWIDRAAAVGGLQRAGVKIADAHTGVVYDLDTDEGDVFMTLGVLFASIERKTILRQTARGKRQALAEGRKHQGPDPYGYASDEDGILRVRDDEAEVVKTIYEMMLRGHTCPQIARELNRAGAPLRERKNGALAWSRERVREIIRTPTYRGEWIADRASETVIPVPAIVEPGAWFAAQIALRETRAPRSPRVRKHVALASGRARCALCGSPIRIIFGSKPYTRYYVCRARARPERGSIQCDLRYWQVARLDELLWSQIERLLIEDWRRVAEAIEASEARDPDETQQRVVELERRIERVTRARSVILRQHTDGAIDDVTLARELDELVRRRDEDAAELARLREISQARWTPEALGETVEAVRYALTACRPEDRLEIVSDLIPGRPPYVITVSDDGIDAVLRLDPQAWVCRARGSSQRTSRTTYPPPLDIRLAC